MLKLYAWEPSFEAQVLKIRDKEIKVLRQAAYLNAGTSFIWSCAPFMVCFILVIVDRLAKFANKIISLPTSIERYPSLHSLYTSIRVTTMS